MKAFKGTKGDWVNGYGNGLTGPTTPSFYPSCDEDRKYIPVSINMETIAIVIQPENNSIEQMYANAKLISAAPDLLFALQNLLMVAKNYEVGNHSINIHDAYEIVEKAINKAI